MFRVTTFLDGRGAANRRGLRSTIQRDFFGRPTYLTVSGQLEAEIGALALSRVYTFGPTFRAENSNTTRHLAEFWMVEPEAAFCDLEGLADLAERFLKSVFSDVLDRCEDDMAFFREADRVPGDRAHEDRDRSTLRKDPLSARRSRFSKARAKSFEFPGWHGARPAERARALVDGKNTSVDRSL